ncbi:MAG: hypothetical protein RLZZ444_3134 [Pseudomonadota bacterium]|jgi:hypothetical protein
MLFYAGAGPLLELDASSALDIGSCQIEGVELAPGAAVPDDGDARILHSVAGFLFTCGPDHIRHPEPLKDGSEAQYPLHGSMAASPATVLSHLSRPECVEVIASTTVHLADGGQATVLRRWRMNADTGEVDLEDRVSNSGTRPFPPMLMYHMNLGAHLFDDKTRITGSMFPDGGIGWAFGEGDGHVFCVPAEPEPGSEYARVVLGPINAIGGKSLHVRFATDTIPHLQMWRNQAGHCNVIGIEPVSHPWKKRPELEQMGLMDMIAPGEFRIYRLSFSFQ